MSGNSRPHFRQSAFRGTMRLAVKELKEILRDRRTIITLVGMPLLIYPLLSILFQKFYFSAAINNSKSVYEFVFDEQWVDAKGQPVDPPADSEKIPPGYFQGTAVDIDDDIIERFIQFNINLGEGYTFPELDLPPIAGVERADPAELDPQFVLEGESRYFKENRLRIRGPDEPPIEEQVQSGAADAGILIQRTVDRRTRFEIVEADRPISRLAAAYLRKRVEATNKVLAMRDVQGLRRQMQQLLQSRVRPASIVRYSNRVIESESQQPRISMASLVPLILILMTVTGAVYPAIDLTAGERERGTLEALIAAPIPRFQVLVAKFIGVLTVAMLTAVVNMTGMFSTLAVFGLLPILFGDGVLTAMAMLQVFALLILFAGFFSAVLLAVTSFARSFKEAQAYIIPLMLLSITPGVISLTPGLELSGILSIVPLVNIVLLAREIMEGTATPIPSVIAITSTTLYGLTALSLAANIFGSDSILYGSQTSWRSLFKRPDHPTSEISISRAMSCLAIIFPLSFLSIGIVSQAPNWYANANGVDAENAPYWVSLIPFVISTFVVFVLVPVGFLWHGNIRIFSALRFRMGRMTAYIAAILIGVCMWPLIGQLVQYINEMVAYLNSGDGTEPEWKKQLLEKAQAVVQQWRTISPVIIVTCFSIVPAICEEFFFRGVLLRALATKKRFWGAIVASALTFGIFHTLSLTDLSSQKFLPSFIAGCVLGWICLKSGSILPGMILHTLNNGILVSVAYYENRLVADGWIEENQDGFPPEMLAICGLACLIGLGIIFFLKRPDSVYDVSGEKCEPSSDPDPTSKESVLENAPEQSDP